MQNLTTGCWIRLTRAERAIEQCAAEWVEEGRTIRNLSLAESIIARCEQARLREPLAVAELPGLTYEPSLSGLQAYKIGRRMVLDATAICAGYYHPVSA